MSEDLMQSTIEEQEFWCNCVRKLPRLEGFSGTGLDKFGEKIAWGTGSHSLKAFRETFDYVMPKNVMELGFNMGYASAVFLELSKFCLVFSCDISLKDETIKAAEILRSKYGKRFMYLHRNNPMFNLFVNDTQFDLCFVDAGHLKEDVNKDITMCLKLRIPFLLFDDILPQFGNVQEVINSFDKDLKLIKTWGNIALYQNLNV